MAALGLMGAADRAWACTVEAPVRDCCPAGTEQPCDSVPSDPGRAIDGGVCCAEAPKPNKNYAADNTKARILVDDASDSHDAAPPLAFSTVEFVSSDVGRACLVQPSSYLADASLTWLRTARLRL